MLNNSIKKNNFTAKAFSLKEEIEISESVSSFSDFKQLQEGVMDPGTLKAVFVLGGPGSGKTFWAQNLFKSTGMIIVNSDIPLENMAKKAGVNLKTDIGSDLIQKEIRPKAKIVASNRFDLVLDQRLGIIVDSTGDKPRKIANQRKQLMNLGYDVYLVIVAVDREVAWYGNSTRSRVIPRDIFDNIHDEFAKNKEEYIRMFGKDSTSILTVKKRFTPKEIASKVLPQISKITRSIVNSAIKNPIGKKWFDKQSSIGSPEYQALVKKTLKRQGSSNTKLSNITLESIDTTNKGSFDDNT